MSDDNFAEHEFARGVIPSLYQAIRIDFNNFDPEDFAAQEVARGVRPKLTVQVETAGITLTAQDILRALADADAYTLAYIRFFLGLAPLIFDQVLTDTFTEGTIVEIPLVATGGVPPYTFQILDANGAAAFLPPDLTLNGDRILGSVVWDS